MPDRAPNSKHIFITLIHITELRGWYYHSHPLFPDEKSETQRVSVNILPKTIYLVTSGIYTPSVVFQSGSTECGIIDFKIAYR